MITRPPRSRPASVASVASSFGLLIRPEAPAATTTACAAASFFTSASILRAKFSASGTSSATRIRIRT
jgi:hypothetical protein